MLRRIRPKPTSLAVTQGGDRSAARTPWLIAAVVAPTGAWAALQQLNAPTYSRAIVAALAAATPLLVGEVRERRQRNEDRNKQLAAQVRFWSPTEGGPRIRDVTDPLTLGVHRSVLSPTRGQPGAT